MNLFSIPAKTSEDLMETQTRPLDPARSLHTIIAALRRWSADPNADPALAEIASNAGEVRPLGEGEIETLIQKLILGEWQLRSEDGEHPLQTVSASEVPDDYAFVQWPGTVDYASRDWFRNEAKMITGGALAQSGDQPPNFLVPTDRLD